MNDNDPHDNKEGTRDMSTAPTESYLDSVIKRMNAAERHAVQEYCDRTKGIPDCFDLIDEPETQFTGMDNPSIGDRIEFLKGFRGLLADWREHLADLRDACWGECKTEDFTLYVQLESSSYEKAAWYFGQHALAELTGAPIIRRLVEH